MGQTGQLRAHGSASVLLRAFNLFFSAFQVFICQLNWLEIKMEGLGVLVLPPQLKSYCQRLAADLFLA